MIIVEFERHAYGPDEPDDSDDDANSYYSSSDDEFEAAKEKIRARERKEALAAEAAAAEQDDKDTAVGPASGPVRRRGGNKVTDGTVATINSEIELTESGNDTEENEEAYVKALGANVDMKDEFRRGINRREASGISGKVYARLDAGTREKKGKREEVKILETHNKLRIKKEVSATR